MINFVYILMVTLVAHAKPTVVACEGLSPLLIFPTSYVQRQVIAPLKAEGLEFDVKVNQWWMSCPKVPKDSIWVTHSMGNGCSKCAVDGVIVSADPRVTGVFVSPKGVRWINFYQTGFMRGYPIEGAENNHVSGYGHTAMPSYPGLLKVVRTEIKLRVQ